MAVPNHAPFSNPGFLLFLGYFRAFFFICCSTGILRHLTVVRTSSLFGHVTKPAPAPAPVNIEKLQEEAQKVSAKKLSDLMLFCCCC